MNYKDQNCQNYKPTKILYRFSTNPIKISMIFFKI